MPTPEEIEVVMRYIRTIRRPSNAEINRAGEILRRHATQSSDGPGEIEDD